MWKHIFGMAKPYVLPQVLPSSVILPHHDITEQQLNSFYSALSLLEQKPSVIVMLCTDHFEQGKKILRHRLIQSGILQTVICL